MFGLNRLIGLYLPAILLSLAGIVTIYSIKPDVAAAQTVFLILALIGSYVANRLKLDRGWLPASFWLIIVSVSLLLTAGFGIETRGSARWITLFGQQFQTSEFAKIGLILFTARWFSVKKTNPTFHAAKYLFLMLLPAVIIFLQPDLGTALMIAAIGIIALLTIGTSLRQLLLLTLVITITLPILFTQLKPYQKERLDSFLNPNYDPLGSGYNAAQATIAVGSGQFIGRGLGQGTQSHLRFLPERHTDFIFASFIEELGLIGGLVILALYLWLCLSLLRVARMGDSVNHSLVCILSAGLIFIQALVNMGMNMGIMPITGVTLPFMSYGGSSLISMYLLLGITTGNLIPANSPKSRVFHIR